MANFSAMFGDQLVTKDGLKATAEVLAGKDVIGIYFSAHWCPPCRGFTPALAQTYKNIKEAGKSFEIVFVSFDRDEGSFSGYYGEMPWVAVTFDNEDIKKALSETHGVSGIPALILLNADGSVKDKNGRQVIGGDPEGAKFPW